MRSKSGKGRICVAYATKQMKTIEYGFEKGNANGTSKALVVVSRIVARLG